MRVRIGIERFDPSRDAQPWIQWFDLDVDPKATLLDVLMRVEGMDPTISIPYSCRRGVCGSCSVEVNGVAVPACSVTMEALVDSLGSELVVKPLPLFPRLKDLVVDRSRALSVIDHYRYWLHRVEPYIPPERMDREVAETISRYRKCSLCFSCVSTCPLTRIDKRFAGPLALRMIIERANDPRDKLDRVAISVAEGLYKCLVCDACTAVCPQDVDIGRGVVELRAIAWNKGLAPIKIQDAVEGVLDPEYGNPLWMPREERGLWLKDLKPSGRSRTLIFAGCMASYVDRDSVRALAMIFELAGVDYVALGDREMCCGMPLYLAGAIEEAKRVAQANVDVFKSMGIERIVTPCPSCYRMFKSVYPALGIDMSGIEVIHAVHAILELVDRKAIRIDRKIAVVATYHDPCDLGRHEGVYEEPRMIIEMVVNKFVEMKRRKRYAQCCGAGGNLRIADPELSLRVGMDRLKRDLPPEARVLIHACPTCKVQLSEASERLGLNIENVSIQELVLRAMRKSV